MSGRVLSAGYVTLDVTCRVSAFPAWDGRITADALSLASGGMAANAAAAAAVAGAEVHLFGQVAAGSIGQYVLSEVAAHGVDISEVERTSGDAPAVCVILVDEAGRRAIVSEPFTLDWTRLDRRLPALLRHETQAALHVDGYHLDGLLERAPLVREQGGWCSVDLDGRTELTADTIAQVAARCDVIVANEASASLTDREPEVLARDLAAGGATVAVTLGADGALVADRGGGVHAIATPDVDVVDTTGAGDVFTGNLLAALLAGATPRQAGHHATVAASLATTAAGARGRLPLPAELAEHHVTIAALPHHCSLPLEEP